MASSAGSGRGGADGVASVTHTASEKTICAHARDVWLVESHVLGNANKVVCARTPHTMLSRMSSARTSLPPGRRTMYLLRGNTSVPRSLRHPLGKSMYMTGLAVSRWASLPCADGECAACTARIGRALTKRPAAAGAI